MVDDIVVRGSIKVEHDKRGGQDTFGLPLAPEFTKTIRGVACHGQRFEKGFVATTSKGLKRFHVKRVSVKEPGVPVKFEKIHNARQVAGGHGVWRFADYGTSKGTYSPLDEFLMGTMLGFRSVCRLNGTSDPAIPGVKFVGVDILTPGSKYTTYESLAVNANQRKKMGIAFKSIADSVDNLGNPREAACGCTYAKDRAGCFCWALQSLWGLSYDVRLADFLKSNLDLQGHTPVKKAFIQAFHEPVLEIYGYKGSKTKKPLSVPDAYARYLTVGCGLSATQLARLKARKLV